MKREKIDNTQNFNCRISKELQNELDKVRNEFGINWSTLTRKFLESKVQELKEK